MKVRLIIWCGLYMDKERRVADTRKCSLQSGAAYTREIAVEDSVLPPLISLAHSQNVEWRLFSLRLLSETTSLLLSHEVMAEEKGEGFDSNNKLLSLIRDLLLPQYEHILLAPDPVPLYALKLLVALTERSPVSVR
ncbi:hypothetical protein TURU_035474 [Turdus rufiventris]|nr:hypothetical protein TURU_035474 [Turdus rufiventris]